jgi:pimeloyl-ACP methyl ester carboxylesterase
LRYDVPHRGKAPGATLRVLKWALGVFGIVVLLIASALGYAAWRHHRALEITSSAGIDEARYVRIGGIEQWIQIRGEDRSNPVILWLNGGPGFSTLPMTYYYRDWEKYFTVVMWDQRGEGKSFDRSGRSIAPTMSIKRMTQDGLEVAEYLRTRLHKDKIILLGHSRGSILGTHMVSERPDLFYAYVGTGQVRNLKADLAVAYPLLLSKARSQNNQKAAADLQAAGPPPYAEDVKYFVPLIWANRLDPIKLQPSWGGVWAGILSGMAMRHPGADFSQNLLLGPLLNERPPTRLKLPVFVIEGPDDLVTAGARPWFDSVTAPQKMFFTIPQSGHLAIFANPPAFLALLRDHVRPLAK